MQKLKSNKANFKGKEQKDKSSRTTQRNLHWRNHFQKPCGKKSLKCTTFLYTHPPKGRAAPPFEHHGTYGNNSGGCMWLKRTCLGSVSAPRPNWLPHRLKHSKSQIYLSHIPKRSRAGNSSYRNMCKNTHCCRFLTMKN